MTTRNMGTGSLSRARTTLVPNSLLCSSQLSFGRRPGRHICCDASSKDDGDIIERIVGKIFGTQALEAKESFGMARLDHPEMFPATLDRFAEPIPEDVGNLVHYRKLLANTQLEKAPLVVAFDTVVDGWTMKRFGEKVYTLGATLLVLELSDIPCVIGGYNPRGWIGLNEDRDSMAAFLFSWPDGDISKSPIKLAKRGGASLAVMDYPNEGIKFGPDGLKCMVPGKEKMVSSRLGPYYDTMPDGLRTLWPGGEKVQQVNRIVAYVSAQGPETYQLDGIVWKTGRAESE